jgi:DNA modification methylase
MNQPIRPYYQDSAVTIFCGDCREIVPLLGRFSLLLTDPPYGLRDKLQGGTWGKSFDGDYRDWDASSPEEWMLQMLIEKTRLQIIWGGNYHQLPASRGWLVWNKPERGLTMADAELAWTNRDCNIRTYDGSRNQDGKRVHPTQKPEKLMRWCIQQAGEVQTILDPFAGSGTTGRAAKDLGKTAVLIEREERYCEIAARRLSQEVLAM